MVRFYNTDFDWYLLQSKINIFFIKTKLKKVPELNYLNSYDKKEII